MTTLTPTTQRITVTADMLWELTAQYPEAEQRIYRGAELVQAGHVERTATPGLFLVRSATATDSAYQVDQCGCSCYDFQKRGGLCKHRAAVALFQAAERADAEQADPTIAITVEPEDGLPVSFDCTQGHHEYCFWHGDPQAGQHCRCHCHPAPIPQITVEPEDEAIPYTLGLRGRLGGEPCELPPQCSRCHAEAAILTHPDRLGRVCLLVETFGEGV